MATARPTLESIALKITAEGRDAFRCQAKTYDNPYFGTRNAIYWLEGYRAEQALVKQDPFYVTGDPRDHEEA